MCGLDGHRPGRCQVERNSVGTVPAAHRDTDRDGSSLRQPAQIPVYPIVAIADDSLWRRSFPGDPSQLSLVRRWLESLLPPCPARNDVTLIATELASNALRHTASGRSGHFAVELARSPMIVQIAVADQGARQGPLAVIEPDEENGRGLLVVAGLSIRMGVLGNRSGRVVWAVLEWDESVAADPDPDEMASLRADHPAFSFSYASLGHHGWCWIAERQAGQTAGVHTVITRSLAELCAALDPQAYAQKPPFQQRSPGDGAAQRADCGITPVSLAYAVSATDPASQC